MIGGQSDPQHKKNKIIPVPQWRLVLILDVGQNGWGRRSSVSPPSEAWEEGSQAMECTVLQHTKEGDR